MRQPVGWIRNAKGNLWRRQKDIGVATVFRSKQEEGYCWVCKGRFEGVFNREEEACLDAEDILGFRNEKFEAKPPPVALRDMRPLPSRMWQEWIEDLIARHGCLCEREVEVLRGLTKMAVENVAARDALDKLPPQGVVTQFESRRD